MQRTVAMVFTCHPPDGGYIQCTYILQIEGITVSSSFIHFTLFPVSLSNFFTKEITEGH